MKGEFKVKVTIIHGQNHKGSTYHLTHLLADQLEAEVTEFFLPKDFNATCIGCGQCFLKSEEKCPHAAALKPLTEALDAADVIILASPVYVYHVTGAMKSFLDHYAYRWMIHRPEEKMFSKQLVCLSTAAGAGMKSTTKDLADSAYFWGIAKIYRYGAAVRATSWKDVDEALKLRLERDMQKLAKIIKRRDKKVQPGLKTKGFFYLVRQIHRHGGIEADCAYWHEKGWDDKKRPWKKDK